jgi:hypothetical protein
MKTPPEGGVFILWRLEVLMCLAKTGLVGVLFVFSDYKSDYF